MTRLRSQDMPGIAADPEAYDAALAARTGLGLRGLAARAAGIGPRAFGRRACACRAAVVPLGAGAGVIEGFAEAVRRILLHLGFQAAVTRRPDAAGLEEAYRGRADLVFLADDERFIAIHTRSRRVVENAGATGAGFAHGLERMAGGVRGRPVLVLGLGPVGLAAAAALSGLGAEVWVHDTDPVKMRRVRARSCGLPLKAAASLQAALRRHRLILDATPARDLIGPESIHPDTFISAPGVPLGLSAAARGKAAGRLIHDRLEIGVAVMAALAVKP
jgi:pyrrolysine biosynthesis protein PylD